MKLKKKKHKIRTCDLHTFIHTYVCTYITYTHYIPTLHTYIYTYILDLIGNVPTLFCSYSSIDKPTEKQGFLLLHTH